jgi:hypothetical protein
MYTSAMRRLRPMLGPLAATWLFCQTATLVLATVAFGFEAVAVRLLECTCAHGADHTDCPMHHPAASHRGQPQLQCTGSADFSFLGVVLGQAGLVPGMPATLLPAPSRAPALVSDARPLVGSMPPEPLPPRA